VDARLSFDDGMCLAKTRKFIWLYQEQGIGRPNAPLKGYLCYGLLKLDALRKTYQNDSYQKDRKK
jgi:hypothetical protein